FAGVDTYLTLYDQDLNYITSNDDGSVGSCSHIEQSSYSLVPPGTYFLQVEDYNDDDIIAAYQLQVMTFPTVCGNHILEPGEACDDGNTISGDGCSSTCRLESAGTYSAPMDGHVVFSGAITPVGSVKAYELDVTAPTYVTAETYAPNVAGGCP